MAQISDDFLREEERRRDGEKKQRGLVIKKKMIKEQLNLFNKHL